MANYEIVTRDGDFTIIEGSTPEQVALAWSRERECFEQVQVTNLATDKSTIIDGEVLCRLAALDNHFELPAYEDDETWARNEKALQNAATDAEWRSLVESC
jgi:hypothetical protein